MPHKFSNFQAFLFCKLFLCQDTNIRILQDKNLLTISIRSLKFFSICWGGNLRIKSNAQSSCCSVCKKNENPIIIQMAFHYKLNVYKKMKRYNMTVGFLTSVHYDINNDYWKVMVTMLVQ